MADLVIDTGYKKRFAKESLLSLPELMLRWPFQCFLKIPFELFNKRLIPYFLLENHTSTNGEQIEIADSKRQLLSFHFLEALYLK